MCTVFFYATVTARLDRRLIMTPARLSTFAVIFYRHESTQVDTSLHYTDLHKRRDSNVYRHSVKHLPSGTSRLRFNFDIHLSDQYWEKSSKMLSQVIISA